MDRTAGVEWIWGLGQWRSLGLRRPGTSGCFIVSRTPIPAFLCPGSATCFLAQASGCPLVPLCFSVCILISITLSLFFRSPSILLHLLGYISISFSPSLTFLLLALPPRPPPSLSLKYIHMQIYLWLSVPGSLHLFVHLCLSAFPICLCPWATANQSPCLEPVFSLQPDYDD